MTDSSPLITNFLSELETLPPEAVSLTPGQIERAADLSDRATHSHQRWQVYLNALALMGFEAWLEQRPTDITLNSHSCAILEPESMDAAIAVCNLDVNGFKLCLIGTGTILENEIAIPKAAIDHPDLKAHFYVPVEVHEEQGQILMTGFLRSDQLSQHQQVAPLSVGEDDTYRLPLQWFEPDTNQLLLYLSCLEPAAIPLSASATQNSATLSPLHQILVEPLVNASLWVQQQWDELAQGLGWLLLPPVSLAGEMRSATRSLGVRSQSVIREFNTLLTDLERRNVTISPEARSACRDLTLGDIPLRLYAVITAIESTTAAPEWSLLLILKAQDNRHLPAQIQLQVTDLNQELVDRIANQDAETGYLYTCVIGSLDEQFLVTLSLPTGESLTLPPFAFQPEA